MKGGMRLLPVRFTQVTMVVVMTLSVLVEMFYYYCYYS
jgi:hypothetical protein